MEPTSHKPAYEDGFKVLQAQHRAYTKQLDKMVAAGIMPGKMAKPGVIWGFARWLYIVGMWPLVVLVLYVVGLYTGIVDRVAYVWNIFLHDNPSAGKLAAAFFSLLVVGFLAFLMLGPLVKLGILPLFGKEKPAPQEEEADVRSLFFKQPMRTRSAYNVLFVIVLGTVTFLLGILLSLQVPLVGTSIMAVVALVVLAWWFWQKNTRPVFGFKQNGQVYAQYFNRAWQLQLADCRSVAMAYADYKNYSRWYDRPFTSAVIDAAGATSLFPFRLILALRNGETKDLVIFNARFANKEHISAQEVEILVAEMLHTQGFHIQLQYHGPHISGWVAQPKH